MPSNIPVLLLAVLLHLSACDGQTEAVSNNLSASIPFGSAQLGVIVNDDDPVSLQIADYYMEKRAIPSGNLIHVRFTPGGNVMRPEEFRTLKAKVDAATPENIQAYALTWTAPYRVGCMSITTAFAAGFNEAFCALGCKLTRESPYFDSNSRHPYDDTGWRPAIMLAGENLEDVKSLIDRGIQSDHTDPGGSGYLLSTNDRARNVRANFYRGTLLMQSDRFRIKIIQRNTLKYRNDVMFYFTGLAKVEDIGSNHFFPGAIADHLTSSGGKLFSRSQMSSLRWLEAGATGSFGTVVEPCAFTQKFPRPDIVIDHYLDGETLIESYWKSVKMPGQGIFIGEPLATPFSSSTD